MGYRTGHNAYVFKLGTPHTFQELGAPHMVFLRNGSHAYGSGTMGIPHKFQELRTPLMDYGTEHAPNIQELGSR